MENGRERIRNGSGTDREGTLLEEGRATGGTPDGRGKVGAGRLPGAGQRSTGRTATDVADSDASTQTSAPRATGTEHFAASFSG